MEPMTIGSPAGSPTAEQYLPAFLLGDNALLHTPKRNKLSPVQERNLPFANANAHSPLMASNNNDSDRKTKTLTNNIKAFGPPIIDLYDDMPLTYRNSNEAFSPQVLLKKDSTPTPQNPTSASTTANSEFRSPLSSIRSYPFAGDASNNVNDTGYRSPYSSPQVLPNDDIYSYPSSVIQQPLGYKRPYSMSSNDSTVYQSPGETSVMSNNCSVPRAALVEQEYWVTIFGFPPEMSREIIDYFKHVGDCIDVNTKPNYNFFSVKYSSRQEARQALNYNGAMYKPGVIIGAMLTEDPDFRDKNIINLPSDHGRNFKSKIERMRSLNPPSLRGSPVAETSQPETTTGIVNKAIEYIMGW